MARAGGELIADADIIAPVPLHWTRLFARHYNQSALLARAVERLSGVRVAPDLLIRARRTPSLRNLGPTARLATVRRAFTICSSQVPRLAGRRVLLVDDVYTTGSTVGACTEALLQAGVKAVDVLTLARVVRPSL